MYIGGFQKFSLNEYPGKTAAIIFTAGCNFRCPYCFNPDLVIPKKYGPPIDEAEIFDFLKRRQGLLEGVVVSGGEPTIHEDLPRLLMKLKFLRYDIKLNTNGTNPKMLRELIYMNMVDYITMDVKAPFCKYAMLAGREVNIDDIKQSIRLIMDSGIKYEFRTTLVKKLLHERDVIRIQEQLQGAQKIIFQPFIPNKNIIDKSLLKKEGSSYSEEEILRFQNSYGLLAV